jgi:hypothetical protein
VAVSKLRTAGSTPFCRTQPVGTGGGRALRDERGWPGGGCACPQAIAAHIGSCKARGRTSDPSMPSCRTEAPRTIDAPRVRCRGSFVGQRGRVLTLLDASLTFVPASSRRAAGVGDRCTCRRSMRVETSRRALALCDTQPWTSTRRAASADVEALAWSAARERSSLHCRSQAFRGVSRLSGVAGAAHTPLRSGTAIPGGSRDARVALQIRRDLRDTRDGGAPVSRDHGARRTVTPHSDAAHGRRTWTSHMDVAHGRRTWTSHVDVARGRRTWTSHVDVARVRRARSSGGRFRLGRAAPGPWSASDSPASGDARSGSSRERAHRAPARACSALPTGSRCEPRVAESTRSRPSRCAARGWWRTARGRASACDAARARFLSDSPWTAPTAGAALPTATWAVPRVRRASRSARGRAPAPEGGARACRECSRRRAAPLAANSLEVRAGPRTVEGLGRRHVGSRHASALVRCAAARGPPSQPPIRGVRPARAMRGTARVARRAPVLPVHRRRRSRQRSVTHPHRG